MQLQEAQETIDNWIRTIGVRYFDELTNMAILCEEVGEVARIMSRLYGEQSFKTEIEANNAKEELKDELADVLFVLLCIANQTKTNMTDALNRKIIKKTERDKLRHSNNDKLK